MRKSFKIILFFIFAILITGILIICFNFEKVKCNLFQFSIIDAMSLLSSVTIGFGLTYLISISFSRESKKNEIIEESLSAIKNDFVYIMQQFIKERNAIINENKRTYFLLLAKNTDKDISILNKLCVEHKNMQKPLKKLLEERRNFHYIATGDQLVQGTVITDDFIDKCSEHYYLIKQNIFQCKIELYNQ